MTADDFRTVRQLEEAVWNALADGDAAADARLLADDFLGVYASGFAGKQSHVDQLGDGPTVRSFALSGERFQRLAPGVVLLAYRATWTRRRAAADAADAVEETMLVTSIWKQDGDRWLNVFSQDTSVA